MLERWVFDQPLAGAAAAALADAPALDTFDGSTLAQMCANHSSAAPRIVASLIDHYVLDAGTLIDALVSAAAHGDDALRPAGCCGRVDVQVVCVDIRLPGMSGIEATRRLRAMNPAIRVIGLSAYAEPHYVEPMLDAGAVGHVTKGDAGERLLHAIPHATTTHPLFGPNIVGPPVADATTALATPAAVDGAPPNAGAASLGARTGRPACDRARPPASADRGIPRH